LCDFIAIVGTFTMVASRYGFPSL